MGFRRFDTSDRHNLNGWIAPDGTFSASSYGFHAQTAARIVKWLGVARDRFPEERLAKLGYVKISGSIPMCQDWLGKNITLTQAQQSFIVGYLAADKHNFRAALKAEPEQFRLALPNYPNLVNAYLEGGLRDKLWQGLRYHLAV